MKGIMQRRTFLKAMGAGTLAAITPRWAYGQPRRRRPNILYIMTDQQSSDAMSCAGNPYLSTPAVDSIAATGVRFDNAYCSFPLCVPARVSMFSGRMPHEAGVSGNCKVSQDPFPFPLIGRLVSEAGYNCHYIGKWHKTIPTSRTEEHGFAVVESPGGHGQDSNRAQLAENFLMQDHEKPFFLVVSLLNPHDCCQLAREEDLSKFDGAIPPLPPENELPPLPDNYPIPEKEPDYLRVWQKEQSERIYKSYFWDDKKFREYQWGYYRLVEKVDRLIGKVLKALRESGQEEDTVVIFSSDHGDGHSRHHWNQKWSLYDESAKVPFIISQKGVTKAGKVDHHLASSTLDLLPTICDYVGIETPGGCLGVSARPQAEGREPEASREYIVSETCFTTGCVVGEDKWPKARMVRTDKYKYIAYDTGKRLEQLTDMEKDPGEMINLAEDEKYRGVLEEHRKLLSEWCRKTNDSFAVPGHS